MRHRLQFKVGIILVAIVVVVMTGFSIHGAVAMHAQLHADLKVLIQNTGDRASRGVADATWNVDSAAADNLLLSELNDTRLQALVITEENLAVFAGMQRMPDGSISDITRGLKIDESSLMHDTFDVMYEDEKLGVLDIYLSTLHVDRALRHYYFSEAIKVVLMSVILILSVYISLRYILIRPLTELTTVANALSNGDLSVTIKSDAVGEVKELANALELFKNSAIEKEELEKQREIERRRQEQQSAEKQQAEEQRWNAENRLQQEKLEASRRENEKTQALQDRADQLLTLVDDVAKGDLSHAISITGNDVIGQIAQRVEYLVDNLRSSLQGIGHSAHTLGDTSKILAESSTSISTNAENTSVQIASVSSAAEKISGEVKMVASAITRMNDTVDGITENTQEAAAVTAKASHITNETNTMVQQLTKSSAGIGSVIKTITSIAEQTNLLALNATIEAARAGDAGRGFSVVANEVKELAKETAKATEEIGQRITAIQTDSVSVTESISSISSIIEQIDELQATVANAVSEQSAATVGISRMISETARGSKEISDSIIVVSSAASSTSSDAKQAQLASCDVNTMADDLRSLVARFNLKSPDSDKKVA